MGLNMVGGVVWCVLAFDGVLGWVTGWLAGRLVVQRDLYGISCLLLWALREGKLFFSVSYLYTVSLSLYNRLLHIVVSVGRAESRLLLALFYVPNGERMCSTNLL